MPNEFLIALSLANMVYMSVWLKYFYKVNFFIRNTPTVKTYIALMLNELLLALVFWAGYRFAKRLNKKWLWIPAKFLFGLLVLLFLYITAICFKDSVNTTYVTWGLLLSALILIILKKMTKVTVKLVLLASPFIAIIFFQCIGGIVADLHQNKALPVQAFSTPPATSPRVLWIIFDEMDQRLSFDKRTPGLKLPEFDRLVQTSFDATKAVGPSNHTLSSMPALIDGKILKAVEVVDVDKLRITYKKSGKTVNWGSEPNLFSGARDLKLNTAIVGDYVPYGRLLRRDLTYCHWTPFRYDFVSNRDTILSHMYAQIYGLVLNPFLPYFIEKISYAEILQESQKTIVNPSYSMMLLHFPVPHSPFIYNRTCLDDYYNGLDGYNGNLILCDRALGKIRRALEKNRLWDRTTILVSADHWLRGGTPDGKIDYRVPFILKLAGEKSSVRFDKPFNSIITHDLLLAVLRGEITTPAQLVHWMNIHQSEQQEPQMIPMD